MPVAPRKAKTSNKELYATLIARQAHQSQSLARALKAIGVERAARRKLEARVAKLEKKLAEDWG